MYRVLKYLVESLAISIAIYLTSKNTNPIEIIFLTLTITAVIIIFETYSPKILSSMKQGIGLGIGLNQTLVGGGSGIDSDIDYLAGTPNIILDNMN